VVRNEQHHIQANIAPHEAPRRGEAARIHSCRARDSAECFRLPRRLHAKRATRCIKLLDDCSTTQDNAMTLVDCSSSSSDQMARRFVLQFEFPAGVFMEKFLYARLEAAQLLSCSLRKIDHLISKKMLGTVRIGRRNYIARKELQRFAQSGTCKKS
jgi:excisionase family DNA binding protein